MEEQLVTLLVWEVSASSIFMVVSIIYHKVLLLS